MGGGSEGPFLHHQEFFRLILRNKARESSGFQQKRRYFSRSKVKELGPLHAQFCRVSLSPFHVFTPRLFIRFSPDGLMDGCKFAKSTFSHPTDSYASAGDSDQNPLIRKCLNHSPSPWCRVHDGNRKAG